MGPSNWIRNGISTLSTWMVPLIVTSMLPWLFPKRLFQSGDREQSGVFQWIFRIASGALLGGVPFLFVAYFAYEGIGGSQVQIDDRLRLPEVKDWDKTPYPRLWLTMKEEYDLARWKKEGPKKVVVPPSNINVIATGNSPKELVTVWFPGLVTVWFSGLRDALIGKSSGVDPETLSPLGPADIWAWINHGELREKNKVDSEPQTYHQFQSQGPGLLGNLSRLYGGVSRYELIKDTPLESITPGNEWSSPARHLSVLTRWYHLIEYCSGRVLGVDALDEYQFAEIWRQHEDIQNSKERMVFRMNQLLLRPDFYRFFPKPDLNSKPPTGITLDEKQKVEQWRETIQRLRQEAEALHFNFRHAVSENQSDNDRKPPDLMGLLTLPQKWRADRHTLADRTASTLGTAS